MDAKLTLKLNRNIIEQAKEYAADKNTSLSKLVESYLNAVVKKDNDKEITPLVKSLSGVIKLENNTDVKEDYRKHILKKYGK